MLTGTPPFDSPIPEEDERCRMVAVNGLLRNLVAGWDLPVCEEVRLSLFVCCVDVKLFMAQVVRVKSTNVE